MSAGVTTRRASALPGATLERDLRSGSSLWCDSPGLGLDVRKLRAPVEVDVAVVGAGVSGAFMAHELSRDFSVAVLERHRPLMGSTIASTALLQWELDLPLIALGEQIGDARAARVYRRCRGAMGDLERLVRMERIACGFSAKRSLYLAGDAYGARALAREAQARADLGLESRFLHPADLRVGFAIERTGAILSEGAASADPGRLTAGLLRRAVRRGALLYAPVEVTGVLRGRDCLTLVNETGFEIRARHVVFCCGYEFPNCVPTDGARIASTWALAGRPRGPAPAWMKDCVVWEASNPYLYMRTTPDGRVIAGGEDEALPDRHADPHTLISKPKAIAARLRPLAPDLDLAIDYVWSGAFGESAASTPLIGAVRELPGCHAVMGFGGNGITFSVIASQIIAAAIRGRPDADQNLFAFE